VAPFDAGGYPVFCGDLRETFPGWWQSRRYGAVLIVADDNTLRDCRPVFLEKSGLPPGLPVALLPAGEVHKTLTSAEAVWKVMLEARLDRRALVVNLGGGVVGDLGGFCAATWKRGVDFVQAPTTLLAMTDASIGGKLGIDFQGIKNAVGVFRNPVAVFADPDFLDTLPEAERRSGLAEVIKHALIGEPALWARLQGEGLSRLAAGPAFPPGLLEASIAVKLRIVREDPQEEGLRALLNYGHTVGHALESFFLNSERPQSHGAAVGTGLVVESYLAWGPGARTAEVASAVLEVFGRRPVPEAAFARLWELMEQDKKNRDGLVRAAVPGEEPFSLRWIGLSRGGLESGLRFYNLLR
jgi:3-dehydroquinate synthase